MTDEARPRTDLLTKVRAIRKREVRQPGEPGLDSTDAYIASILDEVIALIEAETAISDSRLRAALDKSARLFHNASRGRPDMTFEECSNSACVEARAALSPEGRQEPPERDPREPTYDSDGNLL